MTEKVLGFREKALDIEEVNVGWLNITAHKDDIVPVVSLKALEEWVSKNESIRDCVAIPSLLSWARTESEKK